MGNILCPTKIDCACDDNPFANLSAEAPDPRLFFSTAFVQLLPPLGTAWNAISCTSVCESGVSQQAADLCATLQAEECVVGGFTTGGTAAPPGPPPSEPQGTVATGFFLNSPQDGLVFCPDGLPFTYTVPAGLFGDFSQSGADAKAKSYAQQLAAQHVICLGDIQSQVCAGAAYASTIVATGGFLAVAPGGDAWELTSGALPPGLTMDTGNITGGQSTISGTCNVPGIYTFTVSVTDPSGDFQQKTYTIKVAGIINAMTLPNGSVGGAYSQDVNSVGVTNPIFSVDGGALPPGLALDPGGIIFGTPTTNGTFNFVLGVTEAGTGVTCDTPASITISGTCVQPVIKYAVLFSNSAIEGADTVMAYRSGAGHYTFVTNDGTVGLLMAQALNDSTGALLMSGQATGGNGGTVAVYYPPTDNFYCYDLVSAKEWSGATLNQLDNQAGAFGNFTWDVTYNSVNSLVYLNANTDLVVFNPAVNYFTPVADIGSGTPNIFFSGKLSLDTTSNRLFVGFVDASGPVWAGSVKVFDTTAALPALLHTWNIPGGPGGTLINSAIFCPGTNKVYVIGCELTAGQAGDQRDFVMVLDATTGVILHNFTAPDPIGGLATFGGIANPVHNPVANLLYVPGSGSIMVLCTNTDAFLTSMAVTPNGLNGIYVSFNNTVSYVSAGDATHSTINNFG
jgi:hypothetical protein